MIETIEKLVKDHDRNIGTEIILGVHEYFKKVLDASSPEQKWDIIDHNAVVCDIVRKVCKL